MSDHRSIEDVWRAVRAVCQHFDTDTVVVIGSQTAQFHWPNAPRSLKNTPEVDVYPVKIEAWSNDPVNAESEPSEDIAAFFGEGSMFHETHGFYIDGVDERTAVMPASWHDRATTHRDEFLGTDYYAVVPSLVDISIAKLVRADEKDRLFFDACFEAGHIDGQEMLSLIGEAQASEELLARVREIVQAKLAAG